MARLVRDLVVLRDEINATYPKRDKRSDGWIGDAAHQATRSDHNPDKNGIVHAIDVDKDGIDPNRLVAQAIKHPSTEYVIYNRTIWARSRGFKPHGYTGSNPHTGHVHISSRYGAVYDDGKPGWGIKPGTPTKPKPKPKPPNLPKNQPGTRVLMDKSPDMKGEDVLFVQRFIGESKCGKADGIFGKKTTAGVRWYQKMRGIKVDGKVGPQTFRHMGIAWKG